MAKTSITNNTEQLQKYIESIIKKELDSTQKFESFITGTIESINNGEYTIKLSDTDQTSIKAIPINEKVYSKGDYVYVIHITNRQTYSYSILDRVRDLQEEYVNLTIAERFFDEETKKLMDGDLQEGGRIVPSSQNDTEVDENFIKVIEKNGTFKVQAIFSQTDENQEIIGGLKISLLQGEYDENGELIEEKAEVLKTYFLIVDDLVGQPDRMAGLPQEKVFLIEDQDICQNFTHIKFEKTGDPTTFTCANLQLISGSLLNIDSVIQVKTYFENDKDYLSKDTIVGHEDSNSMKICASVYYDGELLTVANQVQYYWLRKDATVTAEKDQYLSLAGDGWACLNSFENASFIGGADASYQKDTIKIWDNLEPAITILASDLDVEDNKHLYLPEYENTLKCLIRFGDNIVESKEFIAYNYAVEKFSANIVCEEPAEILFSQENFALICEVVNENINFKDTSTTDNYNITYEWYYRPSTEFDGAEEEGEESAYTKIEGAEGRILYLCDRAELGSIPEGDNESNYFLIPSATDPLALNSVGKMDCKCIATVIRQVKDADGSVIKEEDVSIEVAEKTILSRVSLEQIIEAVVEYKYFLNDRTDVWFQHSTAEAEDGTDQWDGDWDIYYLENDETTISSGEWISKTPSDKILTYQDIFENFEIFTGLSVEEVNSKYVYYTQRTTWYARPAGVSLEDAAPIKTEYWEFPIIARQVGLVNGTLANLKDGYSIDQLNTFNKLTNGGEDQGIYNAEIGTEVSIASTPDAATHYYKRELGTSNSITYTPINLKIEWDFKTGTDYYIKNESFENQYDKATLYESGRTYYKQVQTGVDESGNNIYKYVELKKNTNNFAATSVDWPEGETGPFYKDVKDRLFINADYIQTGTFRVGDANTERFYASIDDEAVRIGGFTVTETDLHSNDYNSSAFCIWIWGSSAEEVIYVDF